MRPRMSSSTRIAGEQAQERGFPAPCRADKKKHLAEKSLETDVLERLDEGLSLPERLGHMGDLNGGSG